MNQKLGQNFHSQVKSDGTLEWRISQPWNELRKRPADYGVSSPIFNLRDIENVGRIFR